MCEEGASHNVVSLQSGEGSYLRKDQVKRQMGLKTFQRCEHLRLRVPQISLPFPFGKKIKFISPILPLPERSHIYVHSRLAQLEVSLSSDFVYFQQLRDVRV